MILTSFMRFRVVGGGANNCQFYYLLSIKNQMLGFWILTLGLTIDKLKSLKDDNGDYGKLK